MEKQRAIKISSMVLALCLGGGAVYWYLGPEPERELNPVMRELAERSAALFAERLPRLPDVEDLLVVPRVGGRDEDRRLKTLLVDAVAGSRKYSVREWSALREKLESGGLFSQAMAAVGVDEEGPRNIAEAGRAAKQLGLAKVAVDAVLFIRATIDPGKRSDALGAKVELTAQFYQVKGQRELKDQAYTVSQSVESAWNRLYLTYKLRGMSFFLRMGLWLLFVIALPWVTIAFNRKLLSRKENSWNLMLLGFYTGLSMLAAWPLLLALSVDVFSAFLLLLLGGVSGWLHHDALDYTERRLL